MELNKGLRFSIQFKGEKEFSAYEGDIIKGIYKEHQTPDWMNRNNAILQCYGLLKEMQQDEMKKRNHKIQNLVGTFYGYEVGVHEMSAEIIVDSRGKVEMVDSRDLKPY